MVCIILSFLGYFLRNEEDVPFLNQFFQYNLRITEHPHTFQAQEDTPKSAGGYFSGLGGDGIPQGPVYMSRREMCG